MTVSKPTKKSKPSGKRRRAEPGAPKEGAGEGRPRRAALLLVGVFVCAVAAGIGVFFLLPKTPEGPTSQPGPAGAPPPGPAGAQKWTEEALRKEAFALVHGLISEFQGSADAIGLLGTLHNQYGNTAEAVKWWRRCLEKDPKRADVYHGLATIALRKDDYQGAADLWRRAQAINPDLPGMHGQYAEALLAIGELDEALIVLMRGIRLSPGAAKNHLLLGRTHLQRKDYRQAVSAYTRAAQLQPHESRAYYGLFRACDKLGQKDKAEAYLAQFRKLRSGEDKALIKSKRATDKPLDSARILAQTLAGAGRVYLGYRQFAKTEQCWRRGAQIDPQNKVCRQRLVDLYRRTRRGAEALALCEQLTKIDPKNASFHLMTGVLLAELRQFDSAEASLRKGIALAPGLAGGYLPLVQVLLARNRKLPEAKALAGRLVALQPTARHYSLLSEACSRNQDIPGALAAMKRAAELAPDNEAIQKAYKSLQARR